MTLSPASCRVRFPLSRAVCPAIQWPLCCVSRVLALSSSSQAYQAHLFFFFFTTAELAADKEELKRRSKEELLHYLDDKLGKMDAMIRAHLDTPATIDDSVSKVRRDQLPSVVTDPN